MYNYLARVTHLYHSLQDELSKHIFLARLQYEFAPTMTNTMELVRLSSGLRPEEWEKKENWKVAFQTLAREKKKVFLYGTAGIGQSIAEALLVEGIEFYGFCSRDAAAFPGGLLGKPVVSPDYLFAHPDECYAAIAAEYAYDEILGSLRTNHFPEDHILLYFSLPEHYNPYFEFPALFPKDTAFIDGGCYDCQDSIRFAAWCDNRYSKIFAFEPDPSNYQTCKQRAEDQKLRNIEIIQAGLSDRSGTEQFISTASMTSHMTKSVTWFLSDLGTEPVEEIRTVTIDDVARDQTVGFIKMDIEGAEYAALHGAQNTITRDKPFLAICTEHQQGDMLVIMEYLQKLVPAYHFWLRHYGPVAVSTVLYASVME